MNYYLLVNPIIAITLGFEMLSLIALALVITIAIVVMVVLSKKEVDPNEEDNEFDPDEIAKKSQNKRMAKPKNTSRDSIDSEFDFDDQINEEEKDTVDIDELLDEDEDEDEKAEELIEADNIEDSKELIAEEDKEQIVSDEESIEEDNLEPVEEETAKEETAKEETAKEEIAEEEIAKEEIAKEETAEKKADKEESESDETSEKNKDEKILVAGGTKIDNDYDSSIYGKYVIQAVKGEYKYPKYIFELYANNGTLLFQSQKYASLQGCKVAINTYRKNVAENDFVIEKTENNKFKYVLRKGKSVYEGKEYASEKGALSGVDSVKRFSQSKIVEINE